MSTRKKPWFSAIFEKDKGIPLMFPDADISLLNPLSGTFWLEIGTAMLCGAIIGIERQLHGKPLGVGTGMLICFSTYIFVRLGAGLAGEHTDPTRVIGQVITGVGFLGGGVIFARGGTVVGLTTATEIWVMAAIGCTIGYGQLLAAILISLGAVTILIGLEHLERHVGWLRRGHHSRPDQSDNLGDN